MVPRLLTFAADSFAVEVLRRIRLEAGSSEVVETSTAEDFLEKQKSLQRGDASLLIAAHAYDSLCASANRNLYPASVRFVSVVLEENMLKVGSFHRADAVGCWECWRERELANRGLVEQRRELAAIAEAAGREWPLAYFSFFTDVAAGFIQNALLRAAAPAGIASDSVWWISLLTRVTGGGPVVRRHGCPVCGVVNPERTITSLREYLGSTD